MTARRPTLALWLVLLATLGTARASTLLICIDQDPWYPFTFVDRNQVRGMHIDIVRRAAERLGHELELRPLPWRRCLLEAQSGSVDGIATLSFSEDRLGFLRYPDDAALDAGSKYSVLVADDVVVTVPAQAYAFDGDVLSLPTPVRAPRAWGVVDFLRQAGVTVDDSATGEEAALRKLLRDGHGSAIAIRDSAERLLADPRFTGKLAISARPLRSRAYFLAFSTHSQKLDAAARFAFWQAVAAVRDDAKFMQQLQANYPSYSIGAR